MAIDRDQFKHQWFRRFGTANPERMNVPFWLEQIRSRKWPSHWRRTFDCDPGSPVWCFSRYGTSRNRLPDGRIIFIAGEHEDHYDPDFCIYNDVVVQYLDGRVDIFGYPRDVFPPTDFHSATVVGDSIFIVGSLGYVSERRPGETPVYRLNTHTLAISLVETSGENPGWLFKHEAVLSAAGDAILVWGGERYVEPRPELPAPVSEHGYRLDLSTMTWSCLPQSTAVRPGE